MRVGIVGVDSHSLARWSRASFYSPIVRYRRELRDAGLKIKYLSSRRALESNWDVILVDSTIANRKDLRLFDFLSDLRANCTRLIWLDNNDGTAGTRFEVLDYVDNYVKRHVLADPARYLDETSNETVFNEYYRKLLSEWGVKTSWSIQPRTVTKHPLSIRDFKKIRVSWTFAYTDITAHNRSLQLLRGLRGGYPSASPREASGRANRVGALFNSEGEDVRALIRGTALRQAAREGWLIPDEVLSSRRYLDLCLQVTSMISPFGHGEMCFRDFEASWFSSLLFKPSVEHLSTFPNLLKPFQTYVPLSWDPTCWGMEIQSALTSEDVVAIARALNSWAVNLGSDETRLAFMNHFLHCVLTGSWCGSCEPGWWI